MNRPKILAEITGFDCDDHNRFKNWEKHRIPNWECEEIFFNEPLVVRFDAVHSVDEKRHFALGHTDSGEKLFVAFTIRNNLIRPVSFRPMTKNEMSIYEHYKKK